MFDLRQRERFGERVWKYVYSRAVHEAQGPVLLLRCHHCCRVAHRHRYVVLAIVVATTHHVGWCVSGRLQASNVDAGRPDIRGAGYMRRHGTSVRARGCSAGMLDSIQFGWDNV